MVYTAKYAILRQNRLTLSTITDTIQEQAYNFNTSHLFSTFHIEEGMSYHDVYALLQ